MKILDKAASVGDRFLGIIYGLIAALLIIYSAYVIYDNFYTGQTAFASWDLLQYKPVADNDSNKVDFKAITELNSDTAGWLTLYDTNIDYPVVQGKDDLEYAGKDIYGKSSLTGAIYLSSENNKDMSDKYNIIFGHHMDNGAMFGDIDKYQSREYLFSHRRGVLYTPDGGYELNVFACMKTDAYESEIYSIAERANGNLDDVLTYIREKADIYAAPESENIKKIVVLSTCASARTNGRIVIFCEAAQKKSIESAAPVVTASTNNTAKGHGIFGSSGNDSWGLLNLVCVIITMLTLLPLTRIRKKYRQLPYSMHKAGEFARIHSRDDGRPVVLRDGVILSDTMAKKFSRISRDLKKYFYGMIIGLVLEAIVAAAAVLILLSKENFFAPMILSNRYTGLMILIAAVALLIDFIFYRYRGILPPKRSSEPVLRMAAV